MPVEIVMPKLSDTMEEGTILKWLKHQGDHVSVGEPIAEVETDKADMELEASDEGTLVEIKAEVGATVAVGAVIALLEEGGAGAAAAAGDGDADAAGGGARAAKAAQKAPPTDDAPAKTPGARARSKDAAQPGRSSKDRETAADDQGPESGDPPPPADAETEKRQAGAERQSLSRMRQSIARRMTESFRDVPHFYVTAEIDMTEAVRLRDALRESELYATAVTYTHLILKATAMTLTHHPRFNASYRDGTIELHGDVNIGMAVAVEDGLIVPILQHVDELGLEDIAREAHRLAEQARQGRFSKADLSGGTFTVSNMGMLDIEDFAAVINPPQAAILAVGAIKERPIVRDGGIVVAHTMRVTLSSDHRIIDGVMAGRFLEELKRLLENPLVLVVRDR